MEVRLGDLLVEHGVLTKAQVVAILDEQESCGEPFGVLAERIFGVDPAAVECAWARQYATLTRFVDPEAEAIDDRALDMVTRRQAWQFRVLPIRFEPRELMVATTQAHLPRALRFAISVIGYPVFFVLAAPAPLGRALCRHYPLPGLSADAIEGAGLHLLVRDIAQAAKSPGGGAPHALRAGSRPTPTASRPDP
jgi:hypothetical protein